MCACYDLLKAILYFSIKINIISCVYFGIKAMKTTCANHIKSAFFYIPSI